jgi:hypothetical protein
VAGNAFNVCAVASFAVVCSDGMQSGAPPLRAPPMVDNFLELRGEDGAGGRCIAPLAQLGLASAYAGLGEREKSRKAHDEFFTRWKNADPEIPVLRQAKAEYKNFPQPQLRLLQHRKESNDCIGRGNDTTELQNMRRDSASMSSKFLFSLVWLIAMGWSQSGQTNSRMCTYRVAGVTPTICWQVYAHLKNEATVREVKFRPGVSAAWY